MSDDFFDFTVFWELMFGEEDEVRDLECPACGRRIGEGDRMAVVDKTEGIIRCPGCDVVLQVDIDTGKLEETE